jgi:hypothetical protein
MKYWDGSQFYYYLEDEYEAAKIKLVRYRYSLQVGA